MRTEALPKMLDVWVLCLYYILHVSAASHDHSNNIFYKEPGNGIIIPRHIRSNFKIKNNNKRVLYTILCPLSI